MEETAVVTVFLRHGTDVLLLRRSDDVGSYAGQWGAVAGHAEGDPDAAAREEIREETGLGDAVTAVRTGESFAVEDADRGTRWRVHPYLFDCERRDATTNYETSEYEWAPPPAMLDRDTVPDLWESYRRVRPTVETVRADRDHGSASLSLRAVEALRDRAAGLAAGVEDGDAADLRDLAAALVDARPDMAAVRNRVNRAMHDAGGATPAAVRDAAASVAADALAADDDAASAAAELVAGERVVTLSRSGTVLDALRRGDPDSVLVAESRPAREGVGVAESLASAGVDATLTTDAAAPGLVAAADRVLVGADGVLRDGAVVNKVGTYPLALAATRAGVPVTAVCARDKVTTAGAADHENGDPSAVYDGDADVGVANPVFETTPADLVTAVVTEAGELSTEEVAAVAEELDALAAWRED